LTKKISRGLEIYAGVKNLFNFLPKMPLLRTGDPFDKQVQYDQNGKIIASPGNPDATHFDTAYNYAPVQGIRAFAGLRWVLY
jgi:outer membrane receptor for ferrienterochelin and colicins